MIGALISALILCGTITGLLVWQALRAASAKDAELSILKEKSKLERQYDAQDRALGDRDSAIKHLESAIAGERARNEALKTQLAEASELLSQVKPDEISSVVRNVLTRYRELLQVPEAAEGTTSAAEESD